jgi:F-type H+-transporting ATPase subunit b
MMSIISTLLAAGDPSQSPHWFFPKQFELIYGGLASVIIFSALYKFAGPLVKKALSDRTEKIQSEIDSARNAKASADQEAVQIRTALGDVDKERSRILAEADQQAAALLTEGRVRIDTEMKDIEAKAMADIANASSRVGDELRAEIVRLSAIATDRVVRSVLDDRAQQNLIEDFIAKVGASR